MTISFASNTQRIKLNNIGMQLLVRIDGNMYEVTHAACYAQTTDEVLMQTKGFIAHMLNDATGTVVATFIGKELTLADIDNKVNDLRDCAGKEATPLYILNSEGIFQIAKIVFEDPDLESKEEAEDLAIEKGNQFMLMNPDTALIASSEVDGDNEVPKLHFIATKDTMSYKSIS